MQSTTIRDLLMHCHQALAVQEPFGEPQQLASDLLSHLLLLHADKRLSRSAVLLLLAPVSDVQGIASLMKSLDEHLRKTEAS